MYLVLEDRNGTLCCKMDIKKLYEKYPSLFNNLDAEIILDNISKIKSSEILWDLKRLKGFISECFEKNYKIVIE